MVAGSDPWRVRVIGEYLRAQGILPRRRVVVVVVGEHHVNGGSCSDGQRFGWSWISSGRAAEVKLEPGLDHWVPEEATDEVVPPVRFKFLNMEEQSLPAPESCGGRRRRSTARQGDRAVPE